MKAKPTVIIAMLMCMVSVWIMWDQFGENVKDVFTAPDIKQVDVSEQKYTAANFLFMKKLSEATTEEEKRDLIRIFSSCDRKCDLKTDEEIPACILEVSKCLEKHL